MVAPLRDELCDQSLGSWEDLWSADGVELFDHHGRPPFDNQNCFDNDYHHFDNDYNHFDNHHYHLITNGWFLIII